MDKIDFETFKEIGDQSDDVYFIYDFLANKFQYVNAAFGLIWKISREEILQNPSRIIETVHSEDKHLVVNSYRNCFETQSKTNVNFRIICPKQNERWLELKIYPIQKDSRRYMAGIVKDESAQRNVITNMQKINAWKNSAMEILSHNLQGSIGLVQNLASLIERMACPSEKKVAESAVLIREICKQNVELIQHFANQEFLEASKHEISKKRINLVSEMKAILSNYQQAEVNSTKVFKMTCSHDMICIRADKLKLTHIMNNLISNAIKFTPDDGIIEVHIQKKRDTAVISVNDNGIGIPETLQPLLFDKFRGRRTGLKGEPSLGLGMATAKLMVELHHGKIWFDSKENIGTTFFIELPK